jgi:DNA polymerase-3 subunit epsilon
VNPTIPIPKTATEVHHITNEKVAHEPTFKELASQIYQMIKDSDLAGYNSDRFDIPLLAEEMLRAEIDFDMKNRVAIDVQTIFHKKEERTLAAAYKFYCNETLENAHSAAADTNATYEILKAQLDRYEDLENDTKKLAEYTSRRKFVDFAGFIALNDKNEEFFTFGKYKNRLVNDVFNQDQGYYSWIQNADFPLYTKKVLTGIKLKKLNTKH